MGSVGAIGLGPSSSYSHHLMGVKVKKLNVIFVRKNFDNKRDFKSNETA